MITKKFLIAILLIGSLVSCKKVVDVKPEYILDGQELNSIQDFEFALTGAYSAFQIPIIMVQPMEHQMHLSHCLIC